MIIQEFNYRNFFSTPGDLKELFDKSNYPWDLIKKIKLFINKFNSLSISKKYKHIGNNIFIGKNVNIDKSARIEGGAIIGSNSSISHSAYLREGVILGEDVHVGHAVEIKNSIVLSFTALAHLNYIGDSVIGSGVNVAGGVIVANWRFDKKEIIIAHGDEKISTGMEKFGCIMGDNCSIGVNAVVNPGTVLAPNSLVFPLVSVKGVYLDTQIHKS